MSNSFKSLRSRITGRSNLFKISHSLSHRTVRYTLSSVSSLPFGQKGQSTAYIIIFIIVIVFAVMLSGGGKSLFSGNDASPIFDSPSDGSEAGPTATPSASVEWKLTVNLKGCQTTPLGMAIEILPEGAADGYIAAEIEISPGNYLATIFQSFKSPKQAYTYVLPTARGYNSKKWQIELFEGGTKNGDVYSGGTSRKTVTGTATGC